MYLESAFFIFFWSKRRDADQVWRQRRRRNANYFESEISFFSIRGNRFEVLDIFFRIISNTFVRVRHARALNHENIKYAYSYISQKRFSRFLFSIIIIVISRFSKLEFFFFESIRLIFGR